ncbi:GntR family transcriptional regulator [Anaerocolumna sp. AGMB13020]|uniref:GntR family transcriptional regulator n=1 Tax=Anaerocolumna sp. AGMB13020 TaxID=3081750 RepID=UPI0029535D87|nr:GntR family transcriptional regulator [Anaerocolumna sp. AGMB13020]WOO38156.1 GntR family transcriptional regulator [Anaerocolumna sp. AGMB13020]
MEWNIDSERPVYLQIIEQIQRGIISGQIEPGSKLPSVRDLAADAGVNPNTMQKALSELERMELISTYRTNGKFITNDTALIQAMKESEADNRIKVFLRDMEFLGFLPEDIILRMRKYKEEKE